LRWRFARDARAACWHYGVRRQRQHYHDWELAFVDFDAGFSPNIVFSRFLGS
jgi:hypothetical protein